MNLKNKQINKEYEIEEEKEWNLSLSPQSNQFFYNLYNY